MKVVRFRSLAELAPWTAAWDRLARGVPFRSWSWLSAWWNHYGPEPSKAGRRMGLYVLGVFDSTGQPIGMAPWYRDFTPARGRVLRFLGQGEVCSDYLSVLCQPQREGAVAEALAEWLTEANRAPNGRLAPEEESAWDLLELTGVDAEDAVVAQLAAQLQARGNPVHRRPGPNCWRIELPRCWDEFLARLSKSHRKQLRRMTERLLDSGRAVVHRVECLADLERGQEILIELHQRRRETLGQPGCFASARFTAFHREVMPALLRAGQLSLVWVELEGRPVVAEYHLSGEGVVYAYQAGMEPQRDDVSPGALGNLVTIRQAIAEGSRAFDFLRGDEPYKAHWRAEPRASVEIRVAAARTSSRLRHRLWQAGSRVKGWLTSARKSAGRPGHPADPRAENRPTPSGVP